MDVSRTFLVLVVAALSTLPARAEDAHLGLRDPDALERHWPGQLLLAERRLSESPELSQRDRQAVVAALDAASAFLAGEDGKPAARRDFGAGLDALGADRELFLSRGGGLGEIAREVLGPDALLAVLDRGGPDAPPAPGLLALRAEVLYDAGRYPEAAAAALKAWELSGHTDESARALYNSSKGRGEAKSVKQAVQETPVAGAVPAGRSGRVAPPVSQNARRTTAVVPGVASPAGAGEEDFLPSLQSLRAEQAAYAGLREAVSDAPLPVSAGRGAFERPWAGVERDLKLREAARTAAEWLEGDRGAAALRDELSGSRRQDLAGALARASSRLDESDTGRAEARIRSALMDRSASEDARAAAAQELLLLKRRDPGYFAAKAASFDLVRFNREHLADFRAGTRFSGVELGLQPPPGSDPASIDYEAAADGSLSPVRLVSADGTARERGAAPGSWTIFDKAGAVAGWSLDPAAFAALTDAKERGGAISAAARWLATNGFKPGGRADQSDAAASLLGDLLGRPDAGVKGAQLFFDRASGRVSMDSYYERGVKQRVARWEGEGAEGALALYERVASDPNDATTPWRKVMLYRGGAERELLTTKTVSNGESPGRVVTGTTVELLPVAVHYRRDADGRWARDGQTREFREQRQVVHDSAGLVGGSAEVLSVAGRGATDLTASALAAGGALSLYPSRALPRAGALVAEIQQDWFERARVDFVDNSLSRELGENYAGDAYKNQKAAMNLDGSKHIQNVRRELTEQGHPMLGAVTGAGVGFANSMLPMAAGFGALHSVASLGKAGQLAAMGVGIVMTGTSGWNYRIAYNELQRTRAEFDERDPRSMADYYTALQGFTEQSAGQLLLLGGISEVVKVRAPVEPEVVSLPGDRPRQAKLGSDPGVMAASGWTKPEAGYYDVILHGLPDKFRVYTNGKWVDMDHRALARFIRKQYDYDGSSIRLLSCSTGACEAGVAKDLANKLGVPVKAPTDVLHVFSDGALSIGEDPFKNTGTWKIFKPGKK